MPDPNTVLLADHGLAFFCIPKVANTSIKVAILKGLGRPVPRNEHSSEALDYGSAADVLAAGLTGIALVRDPESRLASCWLNKVGGPRFHPGFAHRQRYGFTKGMPWPDFARRVAKIPDRCADQHFRSQSSMLTHRGRLAPRHVFRFEDLPQAWREIQAVALAVGNLKLPDLEWFNRSVAALPASCAAVERLIRTRYAEDYERFGYG